VDKNKVPEPVLPEVESPVSLESLSNSVDFIWSSTTVAVGDTAVLHCSFDAIFSQLRNGNIDWVRETSHKDGPYDKAQLIATGKKVIIPEKRYRVYRPHNSALSVLIVRRAKKRDAGIFRCNLSGSSTRHKYIMLNVTESKIEAKTSPAKLKSRMGKDVTLWCNATGYPNPVVYWTREDRNRRLPDGSYQFWGNGLKIEAPTEADTGIYACYLDNFVQPVVSYKFSLIVEDRPWNIDAYKMRFDSSQWYDHLNGEPVPVLGKSYLLMCETRGAPKPLPAIRWYRDGQEIHNSRHYYIIEDTPEWKSSYTSSTLVIMRFGERQEGNYTCVASNVFRMKKRTFYIKGHLTSVDGEVVSAGGGVGPAGGGIRSPGRGGDYADVEGSALYDDDNEDNTVAEIDVRTDVVPGPTDDEDFEGSGHEQGDDDDDDDEADRD